MVSKILPPLLALLCLLFPASLTGQSWRKPLDRFLDSAPLDRHLWGIAVADSTGRILSQRNGNRMFIPASNTKLVVAAAAAVMLPADWKVETSLSGTGPIRDARLEGHLVLSRPPWPSSHGNGSGVLCTASSRRP